MRHPPVRVPVVFASAAVGGPRTEGRLRHGLKVIATLLALGCAPALETGEPTVLAGTLTVEFEADSAWLTLHVTNPTEVPVQLTYPTAQRSDFEVRTPAGERVWVWSADRGFAQVVTEERLAAGETVRHRVALPSLPAGDYVAVGRLTSSSERLELSTPFQVPARQDR